MGTTNGLVQNYGTPNSIERAVMHKAWKIHHWKKNDFTSWHHHDWGGQYMPTNIIHPCYQGSWGQHGVHLGTTGPRWAPCWPHEPCCRGWYFRSSTLVNPDLKRHSVACRDVFSWPEQLSGCNKERQCIPLNLSWEMVDNCNIPRVKYHYNWINSKHCMAPNHVDWINNATRRECTNQLGSIMSLQCHRVTSHVTIGDGDCFTGTGMDPVSLSCSFTAHKIMFFEIYTSESNLKIWTRLILVRLYNAISAV